MKTIVGLLLALALGVAYMESETESCGTNRSFHQNNYFLVNRLCGCAAYLPVFLLLNNNCVVAHILYRLIYW